MFKRYLLMLAVLGFTGGCSSNAPPPPTAATSASASALPHHEHHPPHHGTLVELGEEFAHVELVVKDGHVTAYVLDGEAENPVRVTQTTLVLHILKPKLPDLVLKAVPNALTGEVVGNTSQFDGSMPGLQGVATFDGQLVDITARGTNFKAVDFNYPKGNETDKH